MATTTRTRSSVSPVFVELDYQLIRNTTSPDETATNVKSFVVNLPALEILKLDTRENLRSYIAEYNARRRNKVHDAIEYTIVNNPQRFITRNSGFVISASAIDVDDKKKIVKLTDASILNGAQSQGEIRRWFQSFADDGNSEVEIQTFFVRAELIVDPDADEVVETAIARNTATPVRSISQAGARGQLEDLEKSIQKRIPGLQIRKSETDEDVFDTRRILQLTRLLMPDEISQNSSPAERLRAYKNPEQCLTDFCSWFDDRDRASTAKAREAAKSKYDFSVSIAPYAIEEYGFWESHEAWNGNHVWEETKKGGRACRRDKKTGKIVWVSPGLVFPIMSAVSEFVEKQGDEWRIVKPSLFKPREMISRAVAQFRACDSDPMQMGRDAGAYDALRIYPHTIMEVMRDMAASK